MGVIIEANRILFHFVMFCFQEPNDTCYFILKCSQFSFVLLLLLVMEVCMCIACAG